jgi:2-oxoglutarate ferredoxin oxidoreductase subunit alpha
MTQVNDFVVRFANVNGTGSASANSMFAKAIFRMGVPVTPKNIFPSNHIPKPKKNYKYY